MSNAIPLPDLPTVGHFRALAEAVLKTEGGTLLDARRSVARRHGFSNWPRFAAHVRALGRAGSAESRLEAAVEAIVDGDAKTLARLLQERPRLARMRSLREHRSTLLHYVSANGVEDYRQKTPPNIVEVAALLLDAGADVNAESDAYAGHSTTLMLTATSVHPEEAGVQIALMELLLERGANIDVPEGVSTVNACLHNGRGQAAEFLAGRGAHLDLEGAAGVGRVDLVESLLAGSSEKQIADGFAWACQFGRKQVVECLLERGITGGHLGLHWAAFSGNADLVELLLARHAPAGRDETYGATPLGWALHSWRNKPLPGHYRAVALLASAGCEVEPGWLADERIRADAHMLAALTGDNRSA